MPVKVYIADDEPHARERLVMLITRFLEDEVTVVGQGGKKDSIIRDILSVKPDIAFLDIEMPDISGIDLAKLLKQNGFHGKIVFVTGFNQYAIKAIRAGAYDYLLKPVDVDEMREMINRYQSENNGFFDQEVVKRFGLSKREMEIVELLAKGLSSETIGEELFLSKHTVNTHRSNILSKTGAKNTVELLNLLKKG